MKSRIINTATGEVLHTANELLHMSEGESYVKGNQIFIVTGKVENSGDGDSMVKSFYVKPLAENETLKLDE